MIKIELPTPSEIIFLSEFKTAQNRPGFYFMKSQKGDILYIGESKNIRKRLREHFKGRSSVTREFKHLFCYVDIHYCDPKDRKIYEVYAINKYDPPGNVWDNCNMSVPKLQTRRKEWIQQEEEKLKNLLHKPIVRVPIQLKKNK